MTASSSRSSQRVLALLRAYLSSGPRGGLPVATWFGHAVLATFFCALVEDLLPPFAYGVFALTLTCALLAIPLLGELGWLLRRDPAEDWAGTLPVRPIERRLARTLHLLCLLGALALASLLPATVLLPEATTLAARLLFPFLGLGLALFVAAVLLTLQGLFAERFEGLLVLVQTLLVIGVVVGLVSGLKHVSALTLLPHLDDPNGRFLWFVPPAWFAAPLATAEGEPAHLWLPALVATCAALVLVFAPAAPAASSGRRAPLLDRLLRPVRALATRTWVRDEERAGFDLVYDALPRENEVVLRTYPMIGIPLAFLIAATLGPQDEATTREGLLALLMFTAGIYLPVLLVQVPASHSARARWIHQCSPVTDGALASGAIKAVATRFVLPLYAALSTLAWLQAGLWFAVRTAVPGALCSLLLCQLLYPICVTERPLSVPPDELRADLDWLGLLGGAALVLTVVSMLVERVFPVWAVGLGCIVLLVLSAQLFRALRRMA